MLQNTHEQHMWNMLAHRALNPTKPLLPINDYLKNMFVTPEALKTEAVPHLKKLDKLFKINENQANEAKKKNRYNANQQEQSERTTQNKTTNETNAVTFVSTNNFKPMDVEDIDTEEVSNIIDMQLAVLSIK